MGWYKSLKQKCNIVNYSLLNFHKVYLRIIELAYDLRFCMNCSRLNYSNGTNSIYFKLRRKFFKLRFKATAIKLQIKQRKLFNGLNKIVI